MQLPLSSVAALALLSGILSTWTSVLADGTADSLPCAELQSIEQIESGICFDVAASNASNLILSYNPKEIDWRSYTRAIAKIAEREPRFCSFVIRANFHDTGAVQTTEVGEISATDGSLLLDFYEFIRPENAYDAFAAFVARILRRLAQYFGITLADALGVAHVACVEELGGKVDILSHCKAEGVPLYVGKLEATFPFTQSSGAYRVSNLPANDATAENWMSFWMGTMNGAVKNTDKPGFLIEPEEALALMGSHTLIDNQACTTIKKSSGRCPGGLFDIFDNSPAPKQRMFVWNNDYFKDGMSGDVRVRGKFGRAPTDNEAEQLEECTFATPGALEVKQNLECKLERAAQQRGIPLVPEDEDFRFVTWKPDSSRADCCGEDCETCSWFDTLSNGKRWCKGNERRAALWFYTINDAHIAVAAKERASTETSKLYDGYQSFKNSQVKFDEAYARALCKLNHIGATYSELSMGAGQDGKPVELTTSLMNQCRGSQQNSQCDSDPEWENNKLVIKKRPNLCCTGQDSNCGQQKFNYFLNNNQICACNDAGEENDDDRGLFSSIISSILGLLGR